jgi:hypothetical protein
MNPKLILCIVAGGLAVIGMVWPNNVITGAAVLLLAVAIYVS